MNNKFWDNNKKKFINSLCFFLCAGILIANANGSAKASSIEDLKQQQAAAQEESDALKAQQEELENSLGDLNSELYSASQSMNEVESQIAELETELSNTQALLDATQAETDAQYAAMKERIQYLYEKGNSSIIEVLIESKDMGAFLNWVEYMTEINAYDRQKLVDYQTNLEAIATYKAELEEKQATLEAKKESLESQKSSLSSAISQVSSNIASTAEEQAAKESEIADYDQKIQAMIAYEKKLEEEKARRDAERLAAIKAQEEKLAAEKAQKAAEGNTNASVDASSDEAYLLAALIECEAGGESYAGQLAVGSVVINRVNSSDFPNTITDVIYQSGQFSPAASGRLALKLETGVSQSCINAANEVLAGNTTVDCLYFCVDTGTIDGIVIDHQVFY